MKIKYLNLESNLNQYCLVRAKSGEFRCEIPNISCKEFRNYLFHVDELQVTDVIYFIKKPYLHIKDEWYETQRSKAKVF